MSKIQLHMAHPVLNHGYQALKDIENNKKAVSDHLQACSLISYHLETELDYYLCKKYKCQWQWQSIKQLCSKQKTQL